MWQVLRTTNNGQSFDTFASADPSLPPTFKLTAFDIVAAGSDSNSFRLFLAMGYTDTAAAVDTMYLIVDTLNIFGGINYLLYKEIWPVSDPAYRGIASISIATDARDKNSGASPYSVSIAAIKAGASDSVIVLTDNHGGAALHRVAVFGTSNELRNISTSIGSASATLSPNGRLGVAWDEYALPTDTSGTIKVAFVDPSDGSLPANGGPFDITITSGKYRRPCITLSQAAGNVGAAQPEIRAQLAYEYLTPTGDIDIYVRVADSIIHTVPDLTTNAFILGNGGAKQLYPHGVYDPAADNFLYTYYDEADNSLVYKSRGVAVTQNYNPITVMANYRNAGTPISTEVLPHMDISMTGGSPAFVWNDNSLSMFDAAFATSVGDIVNAKDVTLYPNPATSEVSLSFTAGGKGQALVTVTDITGRALLVFSHPVKAGPNKMQIPINALVPGNYFVMMRGDNVQFCSRLTILK
jgi:hypothetical protein